MLINQPLRSDDVPGLRPASTLERELLDSSRQNPRGRSQIQMTVKAAGASVVICVYTEDRWDDIIAAVQSVQHQTQVPQELIVVVDFNPRLLKRLSEKFPDVTVVGNRESRGLSGARNTGISVATGELIAFLDDDAAAAPDWLERLTSHFVDPKVLGTGGIAIPNWQNGRPHWFPEEFDWVVGCSYRGLPTQLQPIRNPIGVSCCFRREIFDQLGGFSSNLGRYGTLPAGCEETELCIRATQHWPGHVFLYDPLARMMHRVAAKRERWSYFRSRCYAEGRSKSIVARLVGSGDGLASERSYTLRTLPLGVLRGVVDTVVRRDPSGLARSAAIIAGLGLTVAGYMRQTVANQAIFSSSTTGVGHAHQSDLTNE